MGGKNEELPVADDDEELNAPEAEEPSSEEAEAPETEESEEDQPVTRAELSRITRQFQSLVDKSESRIRRDFQQRREGNNRLLKIAKDSGVPDEHMASLRANLEKDAMEAALGGNGAAEPGDEAPADVDPVTAKGLEIADRYGLTEDDPEAELIKKDGTPEEYFASMRKAGQARLNRLAEEGEDSEEESEKKPARPKLGRAPAMTRSGRAAKREYKPDMKPSDLRRQAADEFFGGKG